MNVFFCFIKGYLEINKSQKITINYDELKLDEL
jgi:hypothetical protein